MDLYELIRQDETDTPEVLAWELDPSEVAPERDEFWDVFG